MVRYKVKADRAAVNEKYITSVFEQLKREKPPGLHYASFKLEDGVTFVHIASLEVADGSNPLSELPAFKAFTAEVKVRCEEQPSVMHLQEIASYRFFGE